MAQQITVVVEDFVFGALLHVAKSRFGLDPKRRDGEGYWAGEIARRLVEEAALAALDFIYAGDSELPISLRLEVSTHSTDGESDSRMSAYLHCQQRMHEKEREEGYREQLIDELLARAAAPGKRKKGRP